MQLLKMHAPDLHRGETAEKEGEAEMTIEEMKAAHIKLNADITAILRTFCKDTGLIVSDIRYEKLEAHDAMNPSQRVAFDFIVRTEATL